MDNWDEIRTAFHVARLGTVSGAAEALGVHHATVIRHVDALEARLGVKLFQRHARGYTATEAGEDLLRVAQATDEQFQQLAGRIKGQGSDVSGELMVTSLINFSPILLPALSSFQTAHPGVTIRYMTDERVYRLEYGEAHVAVRAGQQPDEPDNVVQPFFTERLALYAARSYIEAHGHPQTDAELAEHGFIGHAHPDNRSPFGAWLREAVAEPRILFRVADYRVMEEAVMSGAGIGFVSVAKAEAHPDLVQIVPPRDSWSVKLWLVTHVDLHRTAKVQAFLKHLKAYASELGLA